MLPVLRGAVVPLSIRIERASMPVDLYRVLGLRGVGDHENAVARRWENRLHWVMFGVVLLTIPAFYLELAASDEWWRQLGSMLYLSVSMAFGLHLLWMSGLVQSRWSYFKYNWLDGTIFLGAFASLFGSY